MTKDAGALKTIGEVAEATGIAAHVLRYWERNVPLLKPLRRAGGRRYYRAADVDLVRALRRLVTEEGYTLDGAARAARANLAGPAPVAVQAPVAVHTPVVTRVDAPAPAASEDGDSLPSDDSGGSISLARLMRLRDRLKAALAA